MLVIKALSCHIERFNGPRRCWHLCVRSVTRWKSGQRSTCYVWRGRWNVFLVHNPGGDWHPGKGDNPRKMILKNDEIGNPNKRNLECLLPLGLSLLFVICFLSKTFGRKKQIDLNNLSFCHHCAYHNLWQASMVIKIWVKGWGPFERLKQIKMYKTKTRTSKKTKKAYVEQLHLNPRYIVLFTDWNSDCSIYTECLE